MGRHVTALGDQQKESKRELKKHAATIHCANTLSLLQRKITNALLYHAYQELMLKEEHEINVKQLCRLIGYHGNNHAVIKEALRGLISTVIEWNLINDETGTENWTASSIIASVSLEGPTCYYAYSPRMKQLLHSPSMFGKIDLVIQSNFRSSYGLALYENCIRYRGLPHTKWFDMALFRKLMGVPEGMYDVFRDFKRRVLDKAIDEVNTYSDLFIESEFVREGRKVVRVRFKLKERAKKTRLGVDNKKSAPRLALVDDSLQTTLLNTFYLTEDQVQQLLSEYDAAFVKEKMAMIEASKPFKTGKIQNLAAYLFSAVKNNYKTVAAVNKPTPIKNTKEKDIAELKRAAEKIRANYNTYREQHIHAAIDALPEYEKQRLMDEFLKYAEPVIATVLQLQRKKYSRQTVLTSPQIKALLRQFAMRTVENMTVMTLDDYVNQLDEKKRRIWQSLKSSDPAHPVFDFKD